MSRRFTLVLSLGWFVFTLLACSVGAPITSPADISTAAPATAAPPVEPTVLPPTKVQVEVPTAIPTVAGEVLPTDTPTPSLTPTSTATATVPPTAKTPNPPAATKKSGTVEPLVAYYDVVGIKRNPGDQAVLTLKVTATGGGGGYTYYNDDQKQAGAIFDVAGSCGKPFVHTLKVTSASGQVFTTGYHLPGQCPSPTPTP